MAFASPVSDGDSERFTLEGFDCLARIVFDCDGDTSWLGRFSSERESPNAIDHHARDTWLSRSYQGERFYIPADESFSAEECERDYLRLVDYYQGGWCFVGIVVTVSLEGVELGSDSLWGIESDADAEYFAEVARDCASEAIGQARANLEKLAQASAGLESR